MKGIVVTPNGSVISIREQPDANAPAFVSLEAGDAVDCVAKQGDWYRVNYHDYVGWVHSDYIMTTSDELNGKLRSKLKKAVKTAVNPVATTKAAVKASVKLAKAPVNVIRTTAKHGLKAGIKRSFRDAGSIVKTATGTNGIGEIGEVVGADCVGELGATIKKVAKRANSKSLSTAVKKAAADKKGAKSRRRKVVSKAAADRKGAKSRLRRVASRAGKAGKKSLSEAVKKKIADLKAKGKATPAAVNAVKEAAVKTEVKAATAAAVNGFDGELDGLFDSVRNGLRRLFGGNNSKG